MTSAEIIEKCDRYLFPTYARAPLALVRGEGARVWDADGREYLDFFSSTVVTSLGHAHPAITRAIEEQARRLLHVSNLHYSQPQGDLAELLVRHSFANRVFLCNSGAEANEAAIKLARKYGHDRGSGRYEIITTLGSFHGRTLATISATGQEKVRVGFEPGMPGFRYVPFDDARAVEDAISERTIAVMVEPLQGEGGVVLPSDSYLPALREICDRHDLLLILDEVQTGVGRTGPLFAYQASSIEPDIMTLAKGLGSGVPIGAMLAREEVAESFSKGAHGSTFGGNALCCAVAIAVMETLTTGGLLAQSQARAGELLQALQSIAQENPKVEALRGRGMLLGVLLRDNAAPVVDRARAAGLIVNATAERVVRLAPPLTVSSQEIAQASRILSEAITNEA